MINNNILFIYLLLNYFNSFETHYIIYKYLLPKENTNFTYEL